VEKAPSIVPGKRDREAGGITRDPSPEGGFAAGRGAGTARPACSAERCARAVCCALPALRALRVSAHVQACTRRSKAANLPRSCCSMRCGSQVGRRVSDCFSAADRCVDVLAGAPERCGGAVIWLRVSRNTAGERLLGAGCLSGAADRPCSRSSPLFVSVSVVRSGPSASPLRSLGQLAQRQCRHALPPMQTFAASARALRAPR
jgi:hypothetical protein